MLMESITLNHVMIEPLRRKLKIVTFVTVAMIVFFSCSSAYETVLMPVVITTGLGTGISVGLFVAVFHKVFHQSLFEEEAYTYMMFPFSSGEIVKGKLFAVLYSLLWSGILYAMMWVYLYAWWRNISHAEAYGDIHMPQWLTEDFLFISQLLFHRNLAAESVVFIIGTGILQLILCIFFLCSGAQLCSMLNHLHNPNGRKAYIKLFLVFAGLLIFAGSVFLPTWIWTLCTNDLITVLPIALTMALEFFISICFMRLSEQILEKKYELY